MADDAVWAIARSVPGWSQGDLDVVSLEGGTTNRNFVVTRGGERFVLRVPGKDTELLGIDRANEARAASLAADAGVGPPVVAFPLVVQRLPRGGDVRRHGGRARRASAGRVRRRPRAPRTDRARLNREPITAHDLPQRPAQRELPARRRPPVARRLRVRGMGDPFFDLGNLAVNNELDPPADEVLLRHAVGDVHDRHRARLALMRLMSDFREGMWGVVQQAISTLDEDFEAYAIKHIERLLTNATASPLDAAAEPA